MEHGNGQMNWIGWHCKSNLFFNFANLILIIQSKELAIKMAYEVTKD